MSAHFVRRSRFALVSFAGLAALVACQDKRIQNLDTGITRDSAMTVISQDMRTSGGPDSFPNVYMRDRFIVDGKNYEVLYYTARNEKPGKDTVWKNTTPIVFVENKMIGRGWEFWDSLSTAKKIPLKKRD